MQSNQANDFASLLRHLTVPDNQVRQHAEQQYNTLLKEQSDTAAIGLLGVLSNASVEAHIRELSAVLLRRCLIDEEESTYFRLQNDSKQILTNELLRLLKQESSSAIRLKVCDIAGELGGSILEPKDWPALAPACIELCKSPNAVDREVGLALIGLLADSLISSNDSFLPTAVEILQLNFLANSQDSKALVLTIKALNFILQSIRQPSQIEPLQTIIVPLFQSLGGLISHTITTNNEGNITQLSLCMEHLIDIADHSVTFFSYHLEIFVPSILDCIEYHTQFHNTSFHFLLIEFLVTISMGASKKLRKIKGPNNMKEKDYFVKRFLPLVIQMMSLLPDDSKWEKEDSVEEYNSNSSPCDVGESAFRRVSAAIGVRSTYTVVSSILSSYLPDNINWKRQYAGIQALGCYVEVSTNIPNEAQLQLHCKEVIGTLLHFMNHPIPRIKYATFYATSQFLLYHHAHLEQEQIALILNGIIANIPASINPSPRVRRNAMIALIQFIDIAPSSSLQDQHVSLLEIVCNSLREGPTIVQESCVSAIISIAENSQGSHIWMTYYTAIMPIVKELLSYAYKKGLESLWCQALECITILGESAGKVLFYQDALEIMDLLTKLQNSGQTNEIESSLMKAWVRIARCLGSEFLPYLQFTMNKLFDAMSQDVTVPMNNDYGEEQEDDDEDDDIQMIETNDGWISVRTSAVEEQALAIQMVLLLSEKLQEHFYPYVEHTMRLISKLIVSPHEDIRSFSITVLPELVRTTGKALPMNRTPLKELSNYCLGLLIELLEKESALDIIMTGLQSMRLIIIYACTNWKKSLAIPNATATTTGTAQNTPSPTSTASLGLSTPSKMTTEESSSSKKHENHTHLQSSNEHSNKRNNYIRSFDDGQMLSLARCVKEVFQESLQRRAVLHAEARLQQHEDEAEGEGKNEDDLDEEQHFFQESLELHFNISEVIGALFQTHTMTFYPFYLQEWHEMIMNFTSEQCLSEDRRFALLVLSDVIEFGFGVSNTTVTGLSGSNNNNNNNNLSSGSASPHTPHDHLTTTNSANGNNTTGVVANQGLIVSFFQQLLPVLHGIVTTSQDVELKRTACYAMGISYELHFPILSHSIGDSLNALHTVITQYYPKGKEFSKKTLNEEEGSCVDNAISAVGIITEQSCYHQIAYHQEYLFIQWFQLLPLQYDEEEGEKVIIQLLRMLQELRGYFQEHGNLLIGLISVLIKVVVNECVPKKLLIDCMLALYALFQGNNHTMDHHMTFNNASPLSIHPAVSQQYDPMTSEQIAIVQQHLSAEQRGQLEEIVKKIQAAGGPAHFLHHAITTAAAMSSSTNAVSDISAASTNGSSPYAAGNMMYSAGLMNNHAHATSPLATAPIHDVLLRR